MPIYTYEPDTNAMKLDTTTNATSKKDQDLSWLNRDLRKIPFFLLRGILAFKCAQNNQQVVIVLAGESWHKKLTPSAMQPVLAEM